MEQLSDNKMKEQVKEILLIPIMCNKKIDGIIRRGNVIYTGQTYYGSADEDMSDFAVGFYEIIYKDILCSQRLLDKKYLCNAEFAGDTMNSFKSIANANADANADVDVDGMNFSNTYHVCRWKNSLWKYFEGYHCLANFWILPIDIGRKTMKKNGYDSMDIFLNRLADDYTWLKEYESYYERLSDYNTFCKKHFVEHYEKIESEIIIQNYKGGRAEELINQAQKRIEVRADSISKSDYCGALWEYFNDLKLIQ